jgi:HrpA-like RNA helicase
MSQLMQVPISKASANQRRGRAGRVRNGYCFRMYTSVSFGRLANYSVPEILRVPLEELCLHTMVGLKSSFLFTGPLMFHSGIYQHEFCVRKVPQVAYKM